MDLLKDLGAFSIGLSQGMLEVEALAGAQRGISQRELAEIQCQALHSSLQVCVHSNCPICQKEAKKQAKLDKEQIRLTKKKKQDYDRRVKNWLKIIRG